MKKNGFTLVELLAVIIIIGLIFLLAVTNVIPVFRKSKTKGFINDAVTLAEAARIKYKDDILNGLDDDMFAGHMSGKKCYSIEDDLIGTYASNLNARLHGSVEVCYGTTCTYDTKVWLTNGDMFIDGDIIDENNNNNSSLIKNSFTTTDYLSCGVNLTQSNIVYNFKATGSLQTLTIPENGTYRLEVWGAQGGSASYSADYTGGYGAYATGEITLNQGDILYIGVGEKGVSATANKTDYSFSSTSAYNSGTFGGVYINNSSHGGGGGASHIAISGNHGVLSNYNNYKSQVLIVSGGGGGASSHKSTPSWSGNGGSAGGFIGSSGENMNGNYYQKSYGGTQEAGGIAVTNTSATSSNLSQLAGAFGRGGGDITSNVTQNTVSSGGSGYYGGSGAAHGPGAGGSSYIGSVNLNNKSMYCYNCQEALNLPTDEAIFTVSTTGTSKYKNAAACPSGYSSKPVGKCAKEGNGYVRITHIP